VKKALPYIILSVVIVAVILLLYSDHTNPEKRFDHRISLRKRDKIPYGTFIAFEQLKYLFPGATISTNKKEPAYWDSLTIHDTDQVLIAVTPRFFADEYEMRRILKFAEGGNDVFISTAVVSEEVRQALDCNVSYFDLGGLFSGQVTNDSLIVSLGNPPFAKSFNYSYPGHRFSSRFERINRDITTVLGSGEGGTINFIHMKAGKGNVYVHLSPLAFSNYFLLHNNNMRYYEDVLSVISPAVNRVVWDEYFLNKRYYYENDEDRNRSGWFTTFMGYKSLKWALLTAILALLVFVLLEMRRKQRYIPAIAKPKNDSLDFVKTIGRLYFEKGDHNNLARKMSSYFLEHVRNKYKIPTGQLNEEFIQKLQFKTGCSEAELKEIISFIHHAETGGTISNAQLAAFHKQLESFYQKA
jgi:hypothetical protein